ncbi:hypothetical protein [Streptantibioticus ferralitis]|uniref:Uncharacterized protein n=1 Tax=Streptantibioticus ferralitis TaxID=236510 RepID=A0ABT5Z544_9ACTN|nr:hypothetical protein [Streptantibioticus ferralitis]MDF2258949.1 hypothetical protein [Streptantibioticus ferralitis]
MPGGRRHVSRHSYPGGLGVLRHDRRGAAQRQQRDHAAHGQQHRADRVLM